MVLDPWLETELPRLLPAFLPNQRWFSGKARSIQVVDVEDAVWLVDSPHRCALIVIGVGYADDARERYAMVLAHVAEHAGLPVVGRLERFGSAGFVVEAATDPDAALALLHGFVSAQERRMLRGGTLRYGDADAAAARGLARTAESRTIDPLGTEQSNTSLRLDRTLVFKLFRRIEQGENPDVEVGRYLTTRTTFRAMPMLRGSLTYMSARGESSTLGVLQDWIESEGDGWSHVVSRLRRSGAGTRLDSLPRDLRAMGAITADLHAALATHTADPAFAPEPVATSDVQTWLASLRTRAARTFDLVERTIDTWGDDARALGESLLAIRPHAPALAEPPPSARGFQKIRIHGDYHLGQILRTRDGFTVLDFEGEPTRPLAERRLKQCALKDVAGMVRSFDYAVEAAREQDSNAGEDTLSSQALRESFLDAYVAAAFAHGAAFLPSDRRIIDAWVDFFEIGKALYEVEYEINNRPAWVAIPLRGILRILSGHA
jgi:maltose alpha-D-glucosyltransferase/alpha-amylase